MATQSFYEDMIIDTPEAARNLEMAIELAEKRGPLKIEGARGVEYDPELVRKAIAKAKAENARERALAEANTKNKSEE